MLFRSKSDLSQAEGKFKIFIKLFLQCYQRNISLHSIFKENDPNNNGYISQSKVIQIFKNLPIGLTSKDIEEILSIYYLFDENNNYMYNYLFELEEQTIMGLMHESDEGNINANRFKCGYFTNDKNNFNHQDKQFALDDKMSYIKRKQSFDFEDRKSVV